MTATNGNTQTRPAPQTRTTAAPPAPATPIKTEAPAAMKAPDLITMTEAPFAWNTFATDEAGYSEQFTVRSVTQAPFLLRVAAMKKYLVENHYKPGRGASASTAPAASASGDSENIAPKCGVHGTTMIERTNERGKWWSCPTKNADDSYCKYKPKTK